MFPNEKLKIAVLLLIYFLEFNYTERELLDHHAEPLLMCSGAPGCMEKDARRLQTVHMVST